MIPVDYMQTDRRWANHRYATKGEKSTIKSAGCGITCAAMVIATLKNRSVTPVTTADWSMAHGFKAYHQGTYYTYFTPQLKAYGITCRQMNGASIYHGSSNAQTYNRNAVEKIRAGHWIICCMGKGSWTRSGHFVLWYGIDSAGNALIRDPNSRSSSRRRAPVAKLQYEVKFYWDVETGEEEMTKEEFAKHMDEWLKDKENEEPSAWSQNARSWAFDNGIITGGKFKAPATREETGQMLYAFSNYIQKKLDKLKEEIVEVLKNSDKK